MNRQPSSSSTAHRTDFLLSWDRLGFRLLVFGSLGVLWIIQGKMLGISWADVIRGELVGIMPWAFLAPIVIFLGARYRIDRLGFGRCLAVHLVSMFLVLIPYWIMQRGILLVWALVASGWDLGLLASLKPTLKNIFQAFQNVPFTYLLILLGAEAMKHAQARREQDVQAELLGGQLAEARLALLQRQLNPHFLFNALQAISTLLHRDPLVADRVLVRLSELLRAMLDDAGDGQWGLSKELDLTRRYLEIEQVRFGDRLSIGWEITTDTETQVPSLILLPLVENAIRHGLSRKMGPGQLKVRVQLEGESLVLIVEDDGLGVAGPIQTGVGIGNTRERLKALYAERARLEIEAPPTGGFRVRVHLPLQRATP